LCKGSSYTHTHTHTHTHTSRRRARTHTHYTHTKFNIYVQVTGEREPGDDRGEEGTFLARQGCLDLLL
jgi:hypothetical protein